MEAHYTKEMCAVLWGLAVCTVGFALGVTSWPMWVAIGAGALLPSLAIVLFRNHQALSMSQIIQRALR